MANWIKFDGGAGHQHEIRKSLNYYGCLMKLKDGSEHRLTGEHREKYIKNENIDAFLICEPHPHRDMIIEWANTCRPVWVRYPKETQWELVDPSWSVECEYSFDPPKEKFRFRVALMKEAEKFYTVIADRDVICDQVEHSGLFVKWVADWQEVEV